MACGCHRVSERRACRVLGQARTTQRYTRRIRADEEALRAQITQLACDYGGSGIPRILELLGRQGIRVNRKRLERIWREEGLKVPSKQVKRRRLWLNDGSCIRLRPRYRNHVWSYDFIEDATHDGRKLRMLVVIDEFSRECLAILVARRWQSRHVLECLSDLFLARGTPGYLRSDNGPEFTAAAVRRWLGAVGVGTLFIEPRSPWENGSVESFNGKFRAELLNRELFDTLLEAKVRVERWRQEYNTFRPHNALGYRPPAPEAVEAKTIVRVA
jgi:transposase InsO family protein